MSRRRRVPVIYNAGAGTQVTEQFAQPHALPRQVYTDTRPFITSFERAQHDHSDAANGGLITPNIVDFRDAGTGADYSLTATSYTDITGVTTTHTTGASAQRLLLWLSFKAQGSGANYNLFYRLNVNGTATDGYHMTAVNGVWSRQTQLFIATIPANTTATIKAQAHVNAAETVLWGRDNANSENLSTIKGFAISGA